MEVSSYTSDMGTIMAYSAIEVVVVETILVAHRSIATLLMLAGSLLEDRSDMTFVKDRFPLEELHKVEKPTTENRDASDSENDDEEDDDDAGEQDDDDAGDEDFSGEEGADDDDDDEGDPEEEPAANGNRGNDDDEEDDDEEGEDDE
ncbi:hypothetical protein Leryth_019059, partial [Lithospermum erythrorhizon]